MNGVVDKDGKFAIVDEAIYINEIYKSSGFQVDSNLFDINGPYLMDSQFEAMKNPDRRIRKRKKTGCQHLLFEDCKPIIELIPEIQKAGTSYGYFGKCPLKDNNQAARNANRALSSRSSPSCISKLALENENGMWINNSSEFKKIEHDEDEFLIPPGAKFHMGDVRFISIGKPSVMDPPWINHSAIRTGNYELSDEIIHRVEINCLNETGLVCVWVTNRKGIQKECAKIFKKWNLETLATWNWLKVTKEGEPVCDFKSSHKVPFETVLIGCPVDKVAMWKDLLPERFVFTSVPMAVHSRKPPMQLLLAIFGQTFSRPLELFARNLWPNGTSIGFEPLFLQNSLAFRSNKE